MLPPRATFDPPGAFYETAVHELAHWSEVRTGWDHDKEGYALGELAAEIGTCYVAAELGIPQGEGLGNHAAYLKNWLEALKNDRNFIFKAAKQAIQGDRLPSRLRQEARTRSSRSAAMNETIVIFRKDRTGGRLLRPLPRAAQRRIRSLLHGVPTRGPTLRRRLSRLHRPERPGYARRVCRPVQGAGTAGIHPDRPPPRHA